MSKLEAKIPEGPLAQKWTNYKNHQKLVNPANKRKLDVIVVGTGLAGGAAAAMRALTPTEAATVTRSRSRASSTRATEGVTPSI